MSRVLACVADPSDCRHMRAVVEDGSLGNSANALPIETGYLRFHLLCSAKGYGGSYTLFASVRHLMVLRRSQGINISLGRGVATVQHSR